MFPSKLSSFVFVFAAIMAVQPAFAQGKQSGVRRAQVLLAGQRGERLLSPPADRLKPMPEKAAFGEKVRVQSLTQPQAVNPISIEDLDRFSLPASGKNRPGIPGMTRFSITANRVDKPVELRGLSVPPVSASKLRGDTPPQPVPLP